MISEPQRFDAERCLQSAIGIEAELEALIRGLTESQFHAPPRSGGWSIGYHVEHLIIAGQAHLALWDAALAGRNEVTPNSSTDYRWWERAILTIATKVSWKRRSPDAFVPLSRSSIESTMCRFREVHGLIRQRVEACQTIDVRHITVRSPFSWVVPCGIGLSVDLVLVHERRHLSQIADLTGRLLGGR